MTKPHEIAALIYAELEKLIPSQAIIEDLAEQLSDLVDPDAAAELIRRAATEPTPTRMN